MLTDSPSLVIGLSVALLVCTLAMCAGLALVAAKGMELYDSAMKIKGGVQPRVGRLRRAVNGVVLGVYALTGHFETLAHRVKPHLAHVRDEATRVVAPWREPAVTTTAPGEIGI